MRFITVRDFRTSPAQIWKDLPEEQEMVITNNGKPIALLTPLSDSTLEDTLAAVRKARAIYAIKAMQESFMNVGSNILSETEINDEISDARRHE